MKKFLWTASLLSLLLYGALRLIQQQENERKSAEFRRVLVASSLNSKKSPVLWVDTIDSVNGTREHKKLGSISNALWMQIINDIHIRAYSSHFGDEPSNFYYIRFGGQGYIIVHETLGYWSELGLCQPSPQDSKWLQYEITPASCRSLKHLLEEQFKSQLQEIRVKPLK